MESKIEQIINKEQTVISLQEQGFHFFNLSGYNVLMEHEGWIYNFKALDKEKIRLKYVFRYKVGGGGE